MLLDILKINKIKTAQKEATIPIRAMLLSPSNGLLKSIKVILNMIRDKAKKTKIDVKIFITEFLKFNVNIMKNILAK
jgi:hypothetical protein